MPAFSMSSTLLQPAIPTPHELAPFAAQVTLKLAPLALWLFGSRARGDAHADSDWDILAVVPDTAPDYCTDAVYAWEIARQAEIPITLLVTRQSELAAIWGLPNTIGYDLSREGVRLHVG